MILTTNQILALEDPEEYIRGLFIRLCIINYRIKQNGFKEDDKFEVMQLIESISNVIGYKEEVLNECIKIFSISMNMHHDFYLSWDLVDEYLKDIVKL